MKLKNYSGDTIRDALNQAKEELGDDFVLMESKQLERKTPRGGHQEYMQITVAIDQPEKKHEAKPETSNPFEKLYHQFNSPSTATSEFNPRILSEVTALRQELGRLNTQIRSIAGANFPAPYDRVNDYLVEAGVGRDLAAMFTRHSYLKSYQLEQVTFDLIMATVGSEIIDHIGIRLAEPVKKIESPEIVMLVGPTGSGKTTTVMKLAAKADFYSNKRIVMLTTDTYRVAATEPLKAFSRIVNIPVIEVNSPEDAAKKLDFIKSHDVILIDTPGRSPQFPNYLKELREYRNVLQPTEVLLTLSLTAGVEDLLLATGLYYALEPTGCILTKLDETGRPGKILSIVEEINLPIKYLTDGQSVPNDIEVATAELITNSIMKMMWKS